MKIHYRLKAILLLLVFAITVNIKSLEPVHTKFKLLADSLVITNNSKSQKIGLAIKGQIDKKWHVYWRNPGDTGRAIELKWTLPNNSKIKDLSWSKPNLVKEESLTTYSYQNELLLLTELEIPANPNKLNKYLIAVEVSWLECAYICLQRKTTLKLNLLKHNSQKEYKATMKSKRFIFPIAKQLVGTANLKNNLFNIQLSDNFKVLYPDYLDAKIRNHWQFFPYVGNIIDHKSKLQWIEKSKDQPQLQAAFSIKASKDYSNKSSFKALIFNSKRDDSTYEVKITINNSNIFSKPNLMFLSLAIIITLVIARVAKPKS